MIPVIKGLQVFLDDFIKEQLESQFELGHF